MSLSRRSFINTGLAAAAISILPEARVLAGSNNGTLGSRIKLAPKIGMCKFGGGDPEQIFKIVKGLGYDGIELNSPGGLDKEACLKASKNLGFPIHGVVNSLHWKQPFSSQDPAVRDLALKGLQQCILDAHLVGGSSVLIVPAVVKGGISHQQAWDTSIETIRQALPLAAEKGIHLLIENVWNNFLYDPKGGNAQSAELLCKYIDEFQSPWIGSYFDIGNHQRFGKPAEWIRTLGKRIVKLDVKDWGVKPGFCKIGDGDVDWADVRKALEEIKFTGWATAEVRGGDQARCAEVLANMQKHLLGV